MTTGAGQYYDEYGNKFQPKNQAKKPVIDVDLGMSRTSPYTGRSYGSFLLDRIGSLLAGRMLLPQNYQMPTSTAPRADKTGLQTHRKTIRTPKSKKLYISWDQSFVPGRTAGH
jgi:hypothetical protein